MTNPAKRASLPFPRAAGVWCSSQVSQHGGGVSLDQITLEHLQARHPELRFRGSVITLAGWLTLDGVLADYESKRKAQDPEFTPVLAVAMRSASKSIANH